MAKQQEVKKIGIFSLGKIAAIISFIFGILMAILLLVLQKVMINTPLANAENLAQLGALGTQGLLILPFYYAIVGFLYGIVLAFLYNLVAKYVGGIKINLN